MAFSRRSSGTFTSTVRSNAAAHAKRVIEGQGKTKTYISGAHDSTNLLHRVEIGAQAAVHGEDLLVNDGRNGQAVEAVGERLPELDVVSSLALVVEAVDTVDGGTLMVAAQNEEVLGVLDLVGQEQADGLERLLATVDVITKEQIVGLRRESTVLEKAQEVVVLSVDITADLERAQNTSDAWVARNAWGRERWSRTLIGASSSSRMGCEIKISRALWQR